MRQAKRKLKRRGNELYDKYFFNSKEIILKIVNLFDNGIEIDDNVCDVVFMVDNSYRKQILELIKYYPNKLRNYKIITESIIKEIYDEFGETIEIMNNINGVNVRGKLANSCYYRARQSNLILEIISEDIKLVKICPLLGVPIEYGNNKVTNYSPSLDRIIPSKGYVKDNIQVLSLLANQMKSNATPEELVKFSKNVLKIYDLI